MPLKHKIFEDDRPHGGAYQKTFQPGSGGLPASLTGFGIESKQQSKPQLSTLDTFWNPFVTKHKDTSVSGSPGVAGDINSLSFAESKQSILSKPRVEMGAGVGGGGMLEDMHLDFSPVAPQTSETPDPSASPTLSPHAHVSKLLAMRVHLWFYVFFESFSSTITITFDYVVKIIDLTFFATRYLSI